MGLGDAAAILTAVAALVAAALGYRINARKTTLDELRLLVTELSDERDELRGRVDALARQVEELRQENCRLAAENERLRGRGRNRQGGIL